MRGSPTGLRAGAPSALAAGELHIWWWGHSEGHPQDRRGRVDRCLRQALRHYTRTADEPLDFGREAKGRPFLRNHGAPDFNLSDTSGGTILAITIQGRVGADLERADRSLPALRLARRWFSPEEAAALAARPESTRAAEFVRLWTAKEASCKATGTGIFGHLDRWRFELADGDPVAIQPLPAEAGHADDWQFVRISPADGFTAVLALWGVGFTGLRLIEAHPPN